MFQQAIRQGALAVVDVSDDAKIANLHRGVLTGWMACGHERATGSRATKRTANQTTTIRRQFDDGPPARSPPHRGIQPLRRAWQNLKSFLRKRYRTCACETPDESNRETVDRSVTTNRRSSLRRPTRPAFGRACGPAWSRQCPATAPSRRSFHWPKRLPVRRPETPVSPSVHYRPPPTYRP